MIKLQFQEEVQADVASEIENKVRELIDWTVDKDLDIWYRIAGALERRQEESRLLEGNPSLSEQTERRNDLIAKVSQSIKAVVSGFDRKKQVEELGDLVRIQSPRTAVWGWCCWHWHIGGNGHLLPARWISPASFRQALWLF